MSTTHCMFACSGYNAYGTSGGCERYIHLRGKCCGCCAVGVVSFTITIEMDTNATLHIFKAALVKPSDFSAQPQLHQKFPMPCYPILTMTIQRSRALPSCLYLPTMQH